MNDPTTLPPRQKRATLTMVVILFLGAISSYLASTPKNTPETERQALLQSIETELAKPDNLVAAINRYVCDNRWTLPETLTADPQFLDMDMLDGLGSNINVLVVQAWPGFRLWSSREDVFRQMEDMVGETKDVTVFEVDLEGIDQTAHYAARVNGRRWWQWQKAVALPGNRVGVVTLTVPEKVACDVVPPIYQPLEKITAASFY